MAWERLTETRLGKLPLVLAGPILRKVTPQAVTVWVALRRAATVIPTVLDNQNKVVMGGSQDGRRTTTIGTNLHIIAVTARSQLDSKGLTEGIVYRYNLTFDGKTLADATANADLAYAPLNLPSFALPPRDLKKLRLIHGSCRKPHGQGIDALSILDELIRVTAQSADERPHQLLLTGDQIYADDVADVLLLLLADAGAALLAWKEVLPDVFAKGLNVLPCFREHLFKLTGFTSGDRLSHLMSLGEYASMHLFAWSDVLWPTSLPTFDDIIAEVRAAGLSLSGTTLVRESKRLAKRKHKIEDHRLAVEAFRRTLPSVRKALANVPSYMIFDDHEITDDWNMTLRFCRGVYGRPFGLRVVQNALVAYALCQHWGNTPEQFDGSGAGQELLRLLHNGTAATYDQHSEALRKIVSVQHFKPLDRRLSHGQKSLVYNYTIETPAYQVLVTDTRTCRSFPTGANHPFLLPEDQVKSQILDATPPLGDRLLLVVLSTNAPPVQPIRTVSQHATYAERIEKGGDFYDAWELPSEDFDRLIARLADRLLDPATGKRGRRVILLSGDVHHSFSSRLAYLTKTQSVVIAQLVSSALKNQSGQTIDLHRIGYRYKFGTDLIIPYGPEGYIGWSKPVGSQKIVGAVFQEVTVPFNFLPTFVLRLPIDCEKHPTIALRGALPIFHPRFELSRVPDYRYRLDYLVPSGQSVQPLRPPPIPPTPPGAAASAGLRKQHLDAFHVATGHYRNLNKDAGVKREIIGLNNIGEITFEGTGENEKVHHTLRWWGLPGVAGGVDVSTSLVQWTDYSVSLNPNDTEFPPIKADKGDP